jgi:SAM-dependent methyltransferase
MFTAHTLKQRDFSDENASARSDEIINYQGSPVHELIRDLPIQAATTLLHRRGINLEGKNVLIVGCGLGTDLFYMKRYVDAKYSCTDISDQNVLITKKFFPDANVEAADTEALPYGDDQFDFVFVCDSLHHMARPYLGIYEMLRVAKEGICIIEPHDCLLTRFATRFGLMQEFEAAGNYVLKLSRHDIGRLARSFRLKCFSTSVFATDFGLFERLPMRLRRLFFPVFRLGTALLNTIIPSQGNTYVGVILK